MIKDVVTIRYDIFIAGDLQQAKQVCREYCFDTGFCITIEPVDYIYTGGEESGMRIGIINYPRFPSDKDNLYLKTAQLAQKLMNRLCQQSYSIVGVDRTTWVSRRSEDDLKE